MQKLYRVAWFGDDVGEHTVTLGFIYADTDERAFSEWAFPRSAEMFLDGELNDSAFYTVEQVDDVVRLRDLLDECPAVSQLSDDEKDAIAVAMPLEFE
jgi:hypothetical protein